MRLIIKVSYGNEAIVVEENCQNGILFTMSNGLEKCETVTEEDFLNGNIQFDAPYISIHENILQYVALPANYEGELYYAYKGERIIISDNFFETCKYLGNITMDVDLYNYFYKKSYFPEDYTWAVEVKRLKAHRLYKIKDKILTSKKIGYKRVLSNTYDEKKLYIEFKKKTVEVIETYAKGKNGLLLSGGSDSRLLALLLKESGYAFTAYIGRKIPIDKENYQDVEKAIEVCKLIGCEYKIVDIDTFHYQVKNIKNVIRIMPTTYHSTMIFERIIQQMKEDQVETVWCGQNADNLHNLGPTTRTSMDFYGMMDLFKRFCLSESFLRSYKDIENYNPFLKFFCQSIAKAGRNVYRKMKKNKNVYLPKTAGEYIENFKRSYDYTIFGENCPVTQKSNLEIGEDIDEIKKKYSPNEVKRILYDDKVSDYVKSGPTQIVDRCCKLAGIHNVVFPYSSEMILAVFNEYRLLLRDILFPKKYIYKYIKEFNNQYGNSISSFGNARVIKAKMKNYGDVKNIHENHRDLLYTSPFGKELQKTVPISKVEGWTDIQLYNDTLGKYWMNEVVRILKEDYIVNIL